MTITNSKKLGNREKTQVIIQRFHHLQHNVLQVLPDVLTLEVTILH